MTVRNDLAWQVDDGKVRRGSGWVVDDEMAWTGSACRRREGPARLGMSLTEWRGSEWRGLAHRRRAGLVRIVDDGLARDDQGWIVVDGKAGLGSDGIVADGWLGVGRIVGDGLEWKGLSVTDRSGAEREGPVSR